MQLHWIYNPEVPTPVLMIQGNLFLEASFGVHLDYNQGFFTKIGNDITLGLGSLMSVYLVFNIKDHKKVKNKLTFISPTIIESP